MEMKYEISQDWTLREVYLAWLIAIDPIKFASDNGLTPGQIDRFRTVTQFTWKDFLIERGVDR